ncbi:MAG: DUF4157 domain-containing protein [Deltaproteobacteria bacterium]|nr:DUF4157 domain-containing protein [Deltaproteobacteria bacterium]
MSKKIARDEELQRKKARRYADLLAAQEAARSITADSQAPRPPSSALSRIARKEEEVRRAFAVQNYDLMRMHQGVGNDAIRNTIGNGGNGANRMEERPGAALLDALLAREAMVDADAGMVDPTSDAGFHGDGDFADADFADIADLGDAWDDAAAAAESMSFGGSAPIAPTHVTVRDELAGLDVTYDLAGGAPDVDINQVKQGIGGGAPLDTKTREYMEWRFGVSFEKVRVHTGPKADAQSKALFAHAFALGADVSFQSNTYRPGTVEGDRLLAHELTHVVQAGLARPLTDEEHRALGGGKAAFKTTETTSAISAKAAGTLPTGALAKSGSVSSPTDSFEIEADNTADLVVRHGRAQQAKVRRDLAAADARAREEEKKQQQNGAAAKVDAALQGGGRALPTDVKGKLEALFGRNLDGVKIHDDNRAADAADAVQAHAFTVGQDVVFGSGEYRPGTSEGDALIAHEVTHVVQNMEGRGGQATGEVDGVGVTSVSDQVEREAYAIGDAVAAGGLDHASEMLPVAARQVSAAPATDAVARDEAEASEEIKFTLNLGNRTQRITIPAEQASGSSYSKAVNGIPGFQDPATAHLDLSNNQVTGGILRGTLTAPELQGGITLQISSSGEVSGSQEVNFSLARFARGSVEVTFSNGALTARKSLTSEELSTYGDEAAYTEASGSMMMSGLGTISATASGTATLAGGKLTGDFSVRYREGAANGSFSLKPTYEQFDKIWQNGQAGDVAEKPTLTVNVADGRLEAQEETFAIPAQGKGVSGTSNVTLSYAPGEFSGGGEGNFAIGEWISGTTSVTFSSGGDVNGSFTAETTEFDIGPLHVGALRLSGGLNQGNVNLTIGGSMSAFNGQASGRFTGNITDMSDPQFGGSLTVNLPAMAPTTVNMNYAGGNFTGSGTITPQVNGLSGSANLAFTGETFTADGSFNIALPIVQGATLEIAYADGQVTGTATLDGGDFAIAGVQVNESQVVATLDSEGFSVNGSASASLAGGLVSGNMEVNVTGSSVEASIDSTMNVPGITPVELHAEYSGGAFSGSATTQLAIPFTEAADLTVSFANGRFGGNVRADLAVPFITGGSVQVTVDTDGTITGTVQVAARDVTIPGMTVSGVTVSGSIASTGHLSLQGSGTITGIPAVNSANLTLGVSSAGFSGSVEADLAVPAMKSTRVTVNLGEDGSVSGSADIEAEIAGVSGAVHVDYADGGFSGTGTLSYSRGKFSGSVEAAISREGALSGTGRVSYAITDELTVTGEVTLREDGTMVVGGALECPDRIDLFEKEWKREIFNMTGRFGIPGLSVQLPVVGVVGLEAQLSGKLEAYANVGLYMQNITASGTFDTADNNVELDVGGEIRGEASAGVTATARLAVGLGIGPAFIGGYVQIAGSAGIRAGIGAGVNAHYSSAEDVLALGVNVNASAGLEFALEISGGITASVDLWLTKWEHDWPLASKSWNYNPGVNFDYNPSFDFNLGSEPGQDMLAPSSSPSIDGNTMARQAGGQAGDGGGGGGGGGAQAKMDPNLVQAKGDSASPAMAAAEHGIQGAGRPLPHLEKIQQSFGQHDVTGVQAHTDGKAAEAAKSMGAKAYATGNDVAFGSGGQDLHTAAHEAAHVVQQRAGVATKGGGGQDKWEQHADQVADAVVAGKSAEPLLNSVAGSGSGAVQQKSLQAKSLQGPVQLAPLGGGGVRFPLNLGGRTININVPVPDLEGDSYTCNLPSPITGIQNPQVNLTLASGQVTGGTITGSFLWPIINGDAAFGFTGEGDVTAAIERGWTIAGLGAGTMSLQLQSGDVDGTGTLSPTEISAPGLVVSEFTGSVTAGTSGIGATGSGNTTIANGLVSGAFEMGYDGSQVTGHVDGSIGLPSFITAYAMGGLDPSSMPELDLDLGGSSWTGTVSVNFPVRTAGITGDAMVSLSYNSENGFSGSGAGTFQIAQFFGGALNATIDQAGGVGGTASVTTPTFELGPISVSAIVVNGTITNGILGGDVSGTVSALSNMLSGTFTGSVANGFSFVPSINFNLPQMNQAALNLAYDASAGFSGSAAITPSISFLSGTANTTFGGSDFTANGGFDLNAGFLQNANIGVGWNDGLSGSITLQDQNFNLPHLNISGSSITAAYNNDVTVDGSATMAAANLFDGTLNASWTGSDIDASGTGTLNPPGITPVGFNFAKDGDNLTASASANISVPRVQATNLTVAYDGSNFSGGTNITLDIPFLDSATGRVDVDQNGMSGNFAIQASSFNFSPLTISAASVQGDVRDGDMNLQGTATVSTDMPALEGNATVAFNNLDVTASGGFTFTSALFGSASMDVAYAENRLTGSAAIQPNDITLPYISVSSSTIAVQLAESFSAAGEATVAAGGFFSGTMTASYADNDIDASVAGNINAPGIDPIAITLQKQGDLVSGSVNTAVNVPLVKSATIRAAYENGRFGGGVGVELDLPIVERAEGNIDITPEGQVNGSITVEAGDIELPFMNVDSASVTATITNGEMNLQGSATISAEISALSGTASLSFNGSQISATGGFDLESGFFQSARIDVAYQGGKVTGEGTINANNIDLPMLSVTSSSITIGLADTITVAGSASVTAAGNLFSGDLNVNWTGSDIDGSVDGTFRPPGIAPVAFNLTKQGDSISGSATVEPNIPLVESASFTVRYQNGEFGGSGRAELSLPIVDSAVGTIDIEPGGSVGGSITVNASDIEVPFLTVESASVTAAISNGESDLSGNATLSASIAILTGTANLAFQGTDITGSGGFDIDTSMFERAHIGVRYEDEAVIGSGTIDAGSINVPMLSVTQSSITAEIGENFTLRGSAHVSAASGLFEGDLSAEYAAGEINGDINGTFRPPGINPVDFTIEKRGESLTGSATTTVNVPFTNGARLTVNYDNGEFSGRADLQLAIPFVESASAWVEVTNEGQINGGISVNAGNINLPFLTVNNATVEGEIINGVLRMEGSGSVSGIPMARSCDFTLGVNDGNFYGSVAVDLEIPFTERARGEIEMHEDGSVSGSVSVRAALSGVTGEITANYNDAKWSGTGTLAYNKGPFTGSVTANLSEEGNISGTGRVSYDITPDFTITAEVTLREDGSMEIGGRIDCPDKVDLFEAEYEKNIFNFLARFGIPGLSIQIPIVGVVGLEARLSGSLDVYASLGLYLTDIFASGTFDTATNDVELDIGGSIKGRAEAGMIAAIRFAFGLGIGPAFIGGYIEASGKAAIFAEMMASVGAHYSSAENSLGLDIDLSASAGLMFEFGLEAGLMAEIDLWLFSWSADFPMASKTFQYEAGVAMDYNPNFSFDLLKGGTPSGNDIAGGTDNAKGIDNNDGKDIGGNAEPDDSERYEPCRNVTEKFDLDTEDEYEKGVINLAGDLSGSDADRMRNRFGRKIAGFISGAKLAEVGLNFVKSGANLADTLDWIMEAGAAKGSDVVKMTAASPEQGLKDELKNDDWKVKIQGLTNPDEIAKVVDNIDAELEMKMRWMTEPGTSWALVLPRVTAAPQPQRDVMRTEEWMNIFTGFLTLSQVAELVDLLGGDLTFKWTWIFAANTDYGTLNAKAVAAPQGERDACRGDEWKGQVAGVTSSDEMAELVDIMGGDLHYKWDWMHAAAPQYTHIKAKAEAAPQEERDACRTDSWLGRTSGVTTVDEMAELVDIMGGDLDYKWHWMFTPGTRWDHILAKAEAAPQNERDACRGTNWKPRVIAAVTEDEMAILVDVMGGDLAWKLDWMYDKGSNWGLIEPKVAAAPQGERDGVRNAEWKPRHLGMLVHDHIFILVDMLAGTFDEKWDWIFSSGTHYQAAKDKALSVSAGEYPQVMNDGWMARVITVTNADQMHELTGILGWDLETTIYWMISGGTRWDLIRDKIITAAGGDQGNLNASAKRLRELESVFGWDQMAAAVELTGTLIPGAGQLLGDGAVKGAMESGWAKSNPFPGDPAKRHEEGGWFYLNLLSGSISVVATSGKQASIDLGAAPEVGDSVLVGYFHTHPNPSTEPDESGKQWKADPSPADLGIAAAFEVPAFIRADVGVIAYGPGQRPFLPGPKALPGSGSTTAPQVANQGAEQKKNPVVMSWIKLSKAGAPWKTVAEMLRTSGAGERAALLTDPGVMKWLSKLAPDMQTLLRLMDWEKQPKKPVEGGQALAAQAGKQVSEQSAAQGKAAQGDIPGGKKAKSVMKRDGKKALILLRRFLKKPDLQKVNKRKVWKTILEIVGIWDDHLRADMKPPARIVKMQAKEMMRITMDPLRPWFQRPASIGKVIPRIIKKIKKLLKTPKFIGPPKMKGKKTEDVQKVANGNAQNGVDVGSVAAQGVSGAAGQLPYASQIQQAFGHHDVSGIGAHVGGQAGEAAQSIGASAYAQGDQVAFQGSPSLHTAAHEAAHVVQQAAGAQVSGGVGQSGDRWEQHADQVADAVVAGQSAEQLLDQVTGGGAVASQAVQMKASTAATDHLDKGYFANYKSKDEVKGNIDAALDTEEKAVHASLKSVDELMGPQAQENPSGQETGSPTNANELSDGITSEESGDVPVEPTAQLAAAEKPTIGNIAQPSAEGDRSRQKSDYKSNLGKVTTSKPNLKTNAGPAPKANPQLTGTADPTRAVNQKDESLAESEKLRTEASKAVDDGPGPEEVKEKVVSEIHPVATPDMPTFDAQGSIPKADEFLSKGTIPSEVEDKTDDLGKAQIEQSLSDAKSQISTATGKHEQDISKTKADQEAQQKAMVETANKDMEKEVTKQRKAISDKQKETKDKQLAEVDKVKGKSETEKQKLEKSIDDKVKSSEAEVEQKFADAEKEATAKKTEAEAEAARKKAEAEREAENDSWWDAIGNAVSSAFDALADAVNSVLDAAVSAVNAIVDAAKNAATALIDQCVSFVAGALEAYGSLLKGLVDGLLGDIFPGLAAALTGFIDSAIELANQAVNAIADALKSAVNSLLDMVAGALTGLIEAYKAAINAAMALATAVLTGDWEALGKMILEGVLQVAGIPPADFYTLINNAMDSIDTIIQDPGGFVGNVIDSVGQGFDQFSGNFLQHLQDGFFEWLVGPIGEMGITLPTSWDIVGIFGLTMDVIGLNKDGIQGVVTEELGETAGVVFDYVWRYVEALVTGGVDGLWDAISNDLSSLWEMVVDGIKGWILETIVTQAVLRIATMFNPVGALLNAIMTAYNVYTFVRDEIGRIMGVVTSVVDMIASIAAGSLGPAATAIENALASLIPIAISLLANLLGLGGIANKVKEIIEGVQDTVKGALRKLIQGVKGMFGGGGDEETPAGDTFADLSFSAPTAEGGASESHRIHAEKSGARAVVMIASDDKPFREQVTSGEFEGLDDAKEAEVLGYCDEAEAKYTAAIAESDKDRKKVLDDAADALMQKAKDVLMSVAPMTLEARANIEGGLALTKLAEVRADSACSGLFSDWEAGSLRRHVDENKTVIQGMRDEVMNSGMKYLQKGAAIPDSAIDREKGLSRVVDLPAIFGYYQPANVQQRFMNNEDAFCAATNNSWFDPLPTMTGSLRGRMAQAWWFARDTAPSHTVAELSDELAIGEDSPQYAKGMVRFDIPAAQAMGSKTFRKPTPYDGMPFGEFRASGGVWGVTAGGALEAVAPAIDVSVPAKSLVSGGLTDTTALKAMLRDQFETDLDKMHAKTASAVDQVFESKTKEVFDAGGDWSKVKTLIDGLLDSEKARPLGDHAFGREWAVPAAEAAALEAFNESGVAEWEDTGAPSASVYVSRRKGAFTSGLGAKYAAAKTELNELLWDKTKESSAKTKMKEALLKGMVKTSDIHDQYKPKNVTTPKPVDGSGGDMEFEYEGFRGAKFKIVHRKDQMVTSITGSGLTLKGTQADDVEGRGMTSNSGNRRTTNAGMNSSHLIPDRLRGSGYKNGANLISTSRHYNVPVMSDKEDSICERARDAKEITMNVQVKWMEWDAQTVVDHFVDSKIEAAIVAGLDVDDDKVLQELEDDVRTELSTKLATLRSSNIKRVENVTYAVTYTSHDGQPAIAPFNESTNEWDQWL